jgi:hypothetical protein
LAFSEGAQFRDILLVAEKSKPHSEDIIGVVFLKKSIREMALGDSSKIAEKIREIPCKKGYQKTRTLTSTSRPMMNFVNWKIT